VGGSDGASGGRVDGLHGRFSHRVPHGVEVGGNPNRREKVYQWVRRREWRRRAAAQARGKIGKIDSLRRGSILVGTL
jgi:hypothetical protein